ncbi:MAG: SPOR domain-containing protein [Candidatus Omnitrophica bacterium]|nr:SPOR domain-containing protein [Candidatus Omnitrophota bacterium]
MMDENYKNQTQFELFPETREQKVDRNPRKGFFQAFMLSRENTIVVIIIAIMLMVFLFSMGVEHGRRSLTKNTNQLQQKTAASGQPEKKTSQILENDVSLQPQETQIKEASASVKVVIQQQVEEVKDKIIRIPLEELEGALADELEDMYTVQVASFKLEKNAKREAMILQDRGEDAFVLSKGDYVIVCVGRFRERNDAQTLSLKLKKHYNDCLIRSL